MTIQLVGLCGSLRKGSYNRMALQALFERLPEGSTGTILSIAELPLYNSDLEPPEGAILEFKESIAQADGVVIATPEYNYGIPGPLKNAIDWASRPGYKSVFAHKPVTMFGASGSLVGTARAQGQLKQVLLGMLSEVYPCPEVLIPQASSKFSEDGQVIDDSVDVSLKRLAHDFCQWVQKRKA